MQSSSVRQSVLAGLFIAIGLLLPTLFHMVGMGSAFLPMHIPVFLAGFFLRPLYAAGVGALIPMLSSALTGMPPTFPVLPFMVAELMAYGAVASLLYGRLRLNIYFSLFGSLVAGRVVLGVAVWVLATFFAANLPGPVAFVWAALVSSLPGIVILLLLVPAVVMILNQVAGGGAR